MACGESVGEPRHCSQHHLLRKGNFADRFICLIRDAPTSGFASAAWQTVMFCSKLNSMNDDFDHLWELVTRQFHTSEYSVHGPDHWRRVERNGLLLATRTAADIAVVRLFALFHDSRRVNDGWDNGHGTRGAEYAAVLRGSVYQLPDDRFDLLHYACVWHTDGHHHDDPTIATCWDADRLDLGRVGIIPDPAFMSTAFGREIAAYGSIQPFLQTTANG